MDLHSDFPYWPLKHGIISVYPSLKNNITAEIVVMGGGISGALTAWYLQNNGYDVTLLEKRHIAMGSTAASTSLLQYEIDTPLRELIKMKGRQDAFTAYHLCLDAIKWIENVCEITGVKSVFQKQPSLQFASYKKDKASLFEEFNCRTSAGIEVDWLDEHDLERLYGFRKSGAILSADGATLDAYALTHALLKDGTKKGLRVFDHTEVISILHRKRDIVLESKNGFRITCKKLVIACGYESQKYIPEKIQQLHSTYAIISEPVQPEKIWKNRSLIWETANPYLYLRTTTDNRVIIGGKDIPSSSPNRRDNLLAKKAKELEKSFQRLFPHTNFITDFKWAGSFANTKDGLPYIGSIAERPNTYFALGLGGNGITFSVVAAWIIYDLLRNKKSDGQRIFAFNR
jgi:glycine/D-amino acid oxidase-like deaminating enzyme